MAKGNGGGVMVEKKGLQEFLFDLIGAIHKLAEALGYIRADYIDSTDKRQERGKMIKARVSIYEGGNDEVVLTQDEHGRRLDQLGDIKYDADILNDALDLVLKAYRSLNNDASNR